MTPDQIVDEAGKLSPEALAEVIDRLLWNLHGGQTADEVQAWSEVVTQRLKGVETGQVQGAPGPETLDKLQQPLGR